MLGHTVNLIDGTPRALSEYEGKVVLIVNVASQCGLTPQYAALQHLHERGVHVGVAARGAYQGNETESCRKETRKKENSRKKTCEEESDQEEMMPA